MTNLRDFLPNNCTYWVSFIPIYPIFPKIRPIFYILENWFWKFCTVKKNVSICKSLSRISCWFIVSTYIICNIWLQGGYIPKLFMFCKELSNIILFIWECIQKLPYIFKYSTFFFFLHIWGLLIPIGFRDRYVINFVCLCFNPILQCTNNNNEMVNQSSLVQ